MGSGSRGSRQLLSVIALVCAIGGLVLAAGALPTLASDSPASGIFEGAADGQASGETTASSAAAAGSAASGSSGMSGLDSGLIASLADTPLLGGLLSNLLDGSAGTQPRPDVDDASMDALEGGDDGGMQSDGTSGETGSTDGSGETGSTNSSGETGSTDGSDGTDSTDDSSGTDSTDGGGETGSSSGGTDGGQSTTEGEAGGTDGQTSAARGEDGSDAGADESEADDGSGSDDSDGGDDSSLTDSVSDRAVTAGLVAIAALIVGYVFYTREDPIGTLLSIPGRLVSLALAGVVACSQALERALAALGGLRSIADLPGLVLAAITDAIRSARTRAREVGSSVSTSLFGGAEGATDTDAAVDTQTSARERIRRAFESVIDASPMYRTRVATATPGDVARSATDAGAPGEPVETITDSFRDVEYGDRDPNAYLERTTTAHDRLRDAMESADETDDGGSDSSGDPDE
ncbi:DUF4129 domain-containing protein [Natrinema sp. DC36]|uniref:DUF4129 domain-containing protein n=1 Tax=Natrinema sp. DC36 TaxID=2878680 RepID=UPI001CF06749|nr:DUF4129 domain-containing protein [Natrinema sp. DC36]